VGLVVGSQVLYELGDTSSLAPAAIRACRPQAVHAHLVRSG
jgi:hypothetical protein